MNYERRTETVYGVQNGDQRTRRGTTIETVIGEQERCAVVELCAKRETMHEAR